MRGASLTVCLVFVLAGCSASDAGPTPSAVVGRAAGSIILGPTMRTPMGIMVAMDYGKLNNLFACYADPSAPGCPDTLPSFMTLDCPHSNSTTYQTDFNSFITCYEMQILSNPVVSGLELYQSWNEIANAGPNPDWTFFDDSFAAVQLFNEGLPTGATPMTIHLGVTAGMESPGWLFDELTPCDVAGTRTLDPSVVTTCGWFAAYAWEGSQGLMSFPLPWNATYKREWSSFVNMLGARYSTNPVLSGVSIAGPTAQTSEMILPGGTIDMTHWEALIPAQTKYTAPLNDQVFIDEWQNAIDLYGSAFSGVALDITTSTRGLPIFDGGTPSTVPAPFDSLCSQSGGFIMDCAAQASIINYFAQPGNGGSNAKSVRNDELVAQPWLNTPDGYNAGDLYMGNAAVAAVAQATYDVVSPLGTSLLLSRITGGVGYMSALSDGHSTVGCQSNFWPFWTPKGWPSTCTSALMGDCTEGACIPIECVPPACLNEAADITPSVLLAAGVETFNQAGHHPIPRGDVITPEQQLYNTLQTYFNGTGIAPVYGAGYSMPPHDFLAGTYATGSAPLNYLAFARQDIDYARANCPDGVTSVATCNQVTILDYTGAKITVSFQGLLVAASQQIAQISEGPTASLPPIHVPPGQPM